MPEWKDQLQRALYSICWLYDAALDCSNTASSSKIPANHGHCIMRGMKERGDVVEKA
jgi:hypothetical protein